MSNALDAALLYLLMPFPHPTLTIPPHIALVPLFFL